MPTANTILRIRLILLLLLLSNVIITAQTEKSCRASDGSDNSCVATEGVPQSKIDSTDQTYSVKNEEVKYDEYIDGDDVDDFIGDEDDEDYNDEEEDYDDDDEPIDDEVPCVDDYEQCSKWAESGKCKRHLSYMLDHCRASCGVCIMDGCKDYHRSCELWADEGECEANPDYMLENCKESCEVCDEELEMCQDVDKSGLCSEWAAEGECINDPLYMNYFCQKSCGVCFDGKLLPLGKVQLLPQEGERPHKDKVNKIVHQSRTYLVENVLKNETLSRVREKCINKQSDCVALAAQGECKEDDEWARLSCPLACGVCDMLDVRIRCPTDPNAPAVLKEPGDLHKLMERILSEEQFKELQPRALSRPYSPPGVSEDDERDYITGPWVLAFDSFLNDEECDKLIEWGAKEGFERSGTVDDYEVDGSYIDSDDDEDRTSENSWCYDDCSNDPMVAGILDRIANVTGAPKENYESLQILKYEVGQFYKSHHDMIGGDVDLPSGPRILTLFMYLNDVEKGGGTEFTDLNITMAPGKGKAVLWPSVLDENPNAEEPNTNHEALPVEAGVKYGANAWIHLRDYTPNDNCYE